MDKKLKLLEKRVKLRSCQQILLKPSSPFLFFGVEKLERRCIFLFLLVCFYCAFVSDLLALGWMFIIGSFQGQFFIQDSESDGLGTI